MGLKFLPMAVIAIVLSCSTDDNPDPSGPQQEGFIGTVLVEIVDDEGSAVSNANVRIKFHQKNSNLDGIVFLKDVLLEESTYITVEKAGYFPGSRKFYPIAGNSNYIKIILLEKDASHSFDAVSGGAVILPSGVSIAFPQNSISKLSGGLYDGTVFLSAQFISADDPDLSDKMPGALIGRNEKQDEVALASFGMIGLDMIGANGEILKIKHGATAEIKIPIPDDLISSAPSGIPMWYFSDSGGVWYEEGSAQLIGNKYVANVSHFSFWNCDDWFPTVKWSTTILHHNGSPAAQMKVCITIRDLNTKACSYTDFDGMVGGLVAKDEILSLDVYNNCDNIIHTQQIEPMSFNTYMNPVTIQSSSYYISDVDGSAIGCDGKPVKYGYAAISVDGKNHYAMLNDQTGEFSSAIMTCGEGNASIIVYDEKSWTKSEQVVFEEHLEGIHADSIRVCESNNEFIKLNVLGLPYKFDLRPVAFLGRGSTKIFLADTSSFIPVFEIFLPNESPGIWVGNEDMVQVGIRMLGGEIEYIKNTTVEVTHYEGWGDFVKGNIEGSIYPRGYYYPLDSYKVRINFEALVR